MFLHIVFSQRHQVENVEHVLPIHSLYIHMEGNTLTYGQTELLLLFGKVSGEADLKDFNDMKASEVSVKMMTEDALSHNTPLTQNFIRTLHHTLLREDYTEYRTLPNGVQTSYVIHTSMMSSYWNCVDKGQVLYAKILRTT